MNPFSRLKHCVVIKNDPRENHATECLAACLVFSPRFRDVFFDFLLNSKSKGFETSNIEVETQVSIGSGYIDLVLRQESKFVIAVEIKVKSPENCDHHRRQLQNYRHWLDEQSETEKLLFTLVQNGDNDFRPQDFGVKDRRTWQDLHKRLKYALKFPDLPDAEFSLIENFCNYLESEAIVNTYEIKDLLSYAEGLKARKAVTGIFSEIASHLEVDGFKTKSIEGNEYRWPQLKIQHPHWREIFGDGTNWKVCLWFCIPGIWEASKYMFCPEIEIWCEDHGNDWQFVKSRLPDWFRKLKSENLDWTVWQTWRKESNNIPAEKIQSEPKRIISVWSKAGDGLVLDGNQLQSEDTLIKLLVERIKKYSQVVDSLNG